MSKINLNYIEITQPIGTFYICSIRADILLKIVKVERRSTSSPNGVQREQSEARVKAIADYCTDPDAMFPTPIVISVDHPSEISINEGHHTITIDSEGGIIGDVIDGQHRLWGIGRSKNPESFFLPVVMMVNITVEEKAYIFSTINSNQEKVSKSLIYDLFDVSSYRSPQKTAHLLARTMNNSESSPWYNRLKMLGKKGEDQDLATLSQGTFAKSIISLISRNPDKDARHIKLGYDLEDDPRCIFRTHFIQNRDDIIAKILLNCFNALKQIFPNEWNDPKSNILWKTTGFRAIIYALPELIKTGTERKTLNQEFFEECFRSFKNLLHSEGITLTSEDFPGGSEHNQRKLASKITDSIPTSIK